LHPIHILQLSLEELRKSQRDFKSVQRDLKRDQLQLQRQENQLELEIKKAARQGNNTLAKSLAKVSSVNPSAYILIPPDPDTLISFSAIDTGSQPASKEPKG
jgi:FtsZ-binding cell division protein ZapB